MPFGEYPIKKCPRCGLRMRPLFQSYFCVMNCDRKPKSTVDDDWVLDITLDGDDGTPPCPNCASGDTETFPPTPGVTGWKWQWHCNPCGHAF